MERRLLDGDEPSAIDWVSRAKELRLQVLVTLVEPTGDGKPKFIEHGYRVDAEYFYPASASKLFVGYAVFDALKRWSDDHGRRFSLTSRFKRCVAPAGRCEVPEVDEDKNPDDDRDEEKLSVRRELKKMLAYSDNESYSRLFDLVGHERLHEWFHEQGLSSLRFHHRMSTRERPRSSLRLIVFSPGGPPVVVPARRSTLGLTPTPARGLLVGREHREGRKRVRQPMNFASKNYASLRDLHRAMRELAFPGSVKGMKLGLDEKHRRFLMNAMGLPKRMNRRLYGHKPMFKGLKDVVKVSELEYVGKSGRAYGFHVENAFLRYRPSGRAVIVTTAIYGNPNGVLNDDDYAYDELTRPYLAQLGRRLARVWLVAAGSANKPSD